MKFLITSALVFACLICDSMSLLCYECSNCGNSLGIVTNCTNSDANCSITLATAFDHYDYVDYTTVSKSCLSNCTQKSFSFSGVTGEISCSLVLSCLICDSMSLQCYTCSNCGNSLGNVTNCTNLDANCSVTQQFLKVVHRFVLKILFHLWVKRLAVVQIFAALT
ncbi:unnamed protein product [Brachionus calyciflorus]|uniref:Snake toxin/toxin-like domain-containing protein n=1 Tax=Brachionus calyciflorus TaxID=104777 RepID=A0A813ZH07_9BILA|nr:unnamed protein product [Brachionus calyciflorus]